MPPQTLIPHLEAMLLEMPDAAHGLDHFYRVWHLAQHIAAEEGQGVNARILVTITFLHDLVNYPKNSPLRSLSSTHSADKALELLRPKNWFTGTELAEIHNGIKCHSFSAGFTPSYLSGKILQDADRLDAMGLIGFVRYLQVGASLGNAIYHPTEPVPLSRPLEYSAPYAIDQILLKSLHLPSMMQTATGRRLGEERWVEMRRAMATLLTEAGFENAEAQLLAAEKKYARQPEALAA